MPELTTTIRVEGIEPDHFPDLARSVEDSLVAAIQDEGQATVTAYFVEPDSAKTCLRIGLRFEGMDVMHIEEAATDLITVALERLSGASTRSATSARRTSTQLVGV